ncbi:GNAT family N-acetyltransferase [Kribbella qitaiheensis]|uniref:GNAT family N-acetyltransferase n=1 Tax=Kribbella qitaiheensis TaxID=1544730 RepID=A0A7G6X4Y7_9ACTN|nr:GNAT family protein [Kribbella qitaiheensis]QNE21302.1 GNAT family N-acetyltransferase [Kribbella qitaiheensis]
MNSLSEQPFLRPLAAADVPIYAAWGLDRHFCEHSGWTVDLPLAEHVAHWQKLTAQPKPDHLRLAAVVGDQLVGYVDFAGDEPERRELGYIVGPSDRWGQGLGGAIARLGLEYGFRHLGLKEIWAEAVDANHASIRILTSIGMTETGRGDDEPFLGDPSFYRRFTITVTDWE